MRIPLANLLSKSPLPRVGEGCGEPIASETLKKQSCCEDEDEGVKGWV